MHTPGHQVDSLLLAWVVHPWAGQGGLLVPGTGLRPASNSAGQMLLTGCPGCPALLCTSLGTPGPALFSEPFTQL
jgi:hypothetical protein